MYKKDNDDKYYHIQCKEGDIGEYVLLPGDPFRTDKIAKYLDNPVLVAHSREHKTWTGTLEGVKVSVTSTGMGCPSTAIALEELIACGGKTFIRVGTAGRVSEASMDPKILGTIVTGAVRDEGTTSQYIPIEYPAIAARKVVNALVDASDALGFNYIEGITHSKDSFYTQVFTETVPAHKMMQERIDCWKAGNVMCSEMESAALFVIASIRGVNAGGVMAYSDAVNQEEAVDTAIQIAIKAIRNMIERDNITKK